jgi:flagellar basal-body rod protein FlgB
MDTTNISLSRGLSHRMNYLVDRQGLVSGNVANVNTPRYLSTDIKFRPLTERRPTIDLVTTSEAHRAGNITMTETASGTRFIDKSNIRHDGNSVKLDEEMLKLNEIQQTYSLVTKLYQKHKDMQLMAVRR